ncbi:hypothetical protein Tco_1106469 [Tanacetum coccineum]
MGLLRISTHKISTFRTNSVEFLGQNILGGFNVWPHCIPQIRNAIVKRWSPLYVDEPTNEDDSKKYSICGYTWAFKGNMPAARLTPDDNEARSDWWISSKAYFDGLIGEVERVPFDLSRQNMYEIPSDIYREFNEQKIEIERNKEEVDKIKEEMRLFKEKMNDQPVRQENNEPLIADDHYGLSDFSQFHSMQMGLQSLSIRLAEMRIKRRDSGQQMHHMLLPQDLRESVRSYDQYNG